ncbi:amino acid permease [Suillus clintonianus]|uniref:amino acid permease n=1 Tax=Suillus clintonianus TaxID=1904413 RepID=UPI001B8802C4|nr:amino acid permease [Suillus clintonianus]KAG2130717.1 amino acid permease [Suillus clintonianus]
MIPLCFTAKTPKVLANAYDPEHSELPDTTVLLSNVPLQRRLKERHVVMISIGGVIGTGLFLGTATALMEGGPMGLLLGYTFMGTMCYCVMITVGEMIALLPIPGGHIRLAERFVDPAFSFAMGWNCWYCWTFTIPAELSAAATLIDYWNPGVNNAVWITMCLVIAVGINLFGVGTYGEMEFIFASIKVVTITGLLILGIVLDLGGGPSHDRIGFRYWKNPGPFVQFDGIAGATGQFLGFVRVLIQAAFSFIGTEVVTMAAAEMKNPRYAMPRAIRTVCIRILLFYIGGVFVIGLLVPSNNPLLSLYSSNISSSPFVIAINQAGIKYLPSILNAVILTSAWSASSSDLYLSSRGLYGLAAAGNAPKFFMRTSRSGHPYVAVIFCSLFSLLSYMVVNTSSGIVFTWFSNMTATAGLLAWFCIGVTYIRFRRGLLAQGYDRKRLPYASRLQPYASWWVIASSLVTLLFSGWQVFLKANWSNATFVTTYLPVILFPVLYATAKCVMRVPLVKPSEMDFKSGTEDIETERSKEHSPRNWGEAVWMSLT